MEKRSNLILSVLFKIKLSRSPLPFQTYGGEKNTHTHKIFKWPAASQPNTIINSWTLIYWHRDEQIYNIGMSSEKYWRPVMEINMCVLVIIPICDSSYQDFNKQCLYGKRSLLPHQFPHLVPLFFFPGVSFGFSLWPLTSGGNWMSKWFFLKRIIFTKMDFVFKGLWTLSSFIFEVSNWDISLRKCHLRPPPELKSPIIYIISLSPSRREFFHVFGGEVVRPAGAVLCASST